MNPHHRSLLDPKDLKTSGLKHLQPIETTGSTSQAPAKEKHRWPKTIRFKTSNLKHQISFSLCILGSSRHLPRERLSAAPHTSKHFSN